MDLEIKLQFFQATATALPTVFIAFSLTSHMLDPGSRQDLRIHFFLLSGRTGLIAFAVIIVGFLAAELSTLIVLATDTPTFPVFILVIFYFFLFSWFVGLWALNPVLQSAAVAAEKEATGEDAKAEAVGRYRLLGNVIIVSSLVFLLAGSVIFYALRTSN
jgi:hypothetical protein